MTTTADTTHRLTYPNYPGFVIRAVEIDEGRHLNARVEWTEHGRDFHTGDYGTVADAEKRMAFEHHRLCTT